MEQLSAKEGKKYLSKIWTIFFYKDENFFANPFDFRQLRQRCFFDKSGTISEDFLVYFHLSDKELKDFPDLMPLPEKIYLYGAYNQITVCQMRSAGNIREMTESEKNKFVQLMEKRLSGHDIGDSFMKTVPKQKMLNHEILQVIELMKFGKFYCFVPLDYAYDVYERG
jgi:hypothetical protein